MVSWFAIYLCIYVFDLTAWWLAILVLNNCYGNTYVEWAL